MRALLAQLWSDERGLTSVEYALLLSLFVVLSIAVWGMLARALAYQLRQICAEMAQG
jgi:Flp pilus assembly pilin Flp